NASKITSMTDTYKLNSDTGSFSIYANPSSIPSGVTYSWTVTKEDGSLYTSETTSRNLNVSLADLGFSDANIPTSKTAAKAITITCKVGVDSLPESEWKTNNKTVSIYKPTNVFPNFTIRKRTVPNLSSSGNTYEVTQSGWDQYNDYPWKIEISSTSGFPSGTKYSWSGVRGVSDFPSSDTVAYLNKMFAAFNKISTSGSSITIKCKVSHDDYIDKEASLTLTFKRKN
ncbi:MAG: hypothetical protein IKK38_03145, partial [Spirochaetaceae bacterium]|nr:hypothetical protein [Spirochaetaceae bacterium]